MLTSRKTGLAAGVLALGLLAGCGDAGTGPQRLTREELLGPYMATTFTAESAGITLDRLKQGAHLIITLRADGSTTGQLFVPLAAEGDLVLDLAGTFSFDEGTGLLSFDQPVDTFVRDMTFTAAHTPPPSVWARLRPAEGMRVGDIQWGHQLEGRQSFGGTVEHVVLRQYFMALIDRVGSL